MPSSEGSEDETNLTGDTLCQFIHFFAFLQKIFIYLGKFQVSNKIEKGALGFSMYPLPSPVVNTTQQDGTLFIKVEPTLMYHNT